MSQNTFPQDPKNSFETELDFPETSATSLDEDFDDLSFLDDLDSKTSENSVQQTDIDFDTATDAPVYGREPIDNLADHLIDPLADDKTPTSFDDNLFEEDSSTTSTDNNDNLDDFLNQITDNTTPSPEPVVAAAALPADKKAKKSLFSFGKKTDSKKSTKTTETGAKKPPFAFGSKPKAQNNKEPKANKSLFSFGSKPKSDKTGLDGSPKKSAFGTPKATPKTGKASLASNNKPKARANPNNKKLNLLILGGLLALVLLAVSWFLMNNPMNEVAPPIAQPQPTVPAPEQPPVPTDAPVVADVPTDGDVLAGDAGTPVDAPLVEQTPAIDADAIVQAEVPQDPALIKEEIDRLTDTRGQYEEQAQIIDEQLGKLEELTAVKEEKIALLEAQIAQLEAQKKQ